jgi:hypothetical protein
MKFTFKTDHPTGQYRGFFPNTNHIKYNKINVGLIVGSSNYNNIGPYKIRLQVIKNDIMEDGNPNCNWKWITLKHESATVQEAKDFLNNNIDKILNTFELVKE